MSKQATSYQFNEIASILKCELYKPLLIGKQIYVTRLGRLYFKGSKRYNYPHKNWWYSIDPNFVRDNKIDYLCLAADKTGFFLIPVEKFFDYRKHNIIGCVKGGREDFTVIVTNGRFLRHESKCSTWDITEYFHSATTTKKVDMCLF